MKRRGPQYSTAVREIPTEDRPRERLERVGPEALRDAELLAILFRTGTRKKGAVAVAEEVIRHFGSLRALAQASLEELQEVDGLGRVKSIEIKTALELGKRLVAYREPERRKIRTAEDVADLLMVEFKDYEDEHFKCVLVTTKKDLIKVVDVSRGGLSVTPADPRDVFRWAIRAGASGVFICHNHPSGNPEPSRDDILLTKRLAESGELLGVSVLDHVIFGDGRWFSLREQGMM